MTKAGQLQLKHSHVARRRAPPAGAARLIRLDDSISIGAHENVGKRMGIGEEVDLALEREPGTPAWRTSRRDSWAGILHLWDRGGMEERLRAPSPMEAAAKTRGNAEALRSPRSDVIRRGRGWGRLCLVTLRLLFGAPADAFSAFQEVPLLILRPDPAPTAPLSPFSIG